ncbi:glycosyltransferase family 2 protein [Roseovarius faecimaris]|uniref:glycosyltransferase family 2 protein n=1 Tax=Roseovarius faecimaris TaxID=2494550 RepID=UPI001FE41569|nr:glycosyltransferase family 2 protein [Roseovarius faecimaris]
MLDYSDTVVLVPCLNEEASVAKVVEGFQNHLPGCRIVVYDNNSTDDTVALAAASGAEVRHEKMRGKGHVVRRMFRDIDAQIYILTDGDLTYDPSKAPAMIDLLRKDALDVVIGRRIDAGGKEYRRGHRFGNRALTSTISRLFRSELSDMLSGYRVMSRRFVKSFPVEAKGFEIETELTVHMLQLSIPFAEVDTEYGARHEDTESKLRTFVDGFRILRTIAGLTILERPTLVFGASGFAACLVALAMFLPVLAEFQQTGLVGRLPTLVVSIVLGSTGLVSIFTGLILSGITRTRRDMKRLAYLRLPPPVPSE